ncbi:proton channel OtopLc-like isoform X1 [Crassostrea angulata]|uniref:proton channel OtopLc-like isoform X1 n=1 Tax=Magallana angulata TaxID=2784310 RepID=UPI0022B1ED85|nr:proton channel OtopLc-like isoform X1 [Crassostrea angulata]
MEDSVQLTDFRALRRSSSVGDLDNCKFIYDTNKELRERLTRANERKKVNQCYNQSEDELRPRSLTVECMERPPRRPRPTPRHSKSLKFNREHSQQSEDSVLMSDLQDLKSFTSDRDLTRTKSLLKPTPVYPEDVSDYTTTDQGSYISLSETSGQSQGWTENEETPPIGESPETKGFKFTPSNRDPRWLNRVKLDHSLPALDHMSLLLKSKPRAYSERNLHRLQNKHGIIASTKEGESSESSYKRGPSRGVQNGLYSDSDPKFESDDSAFLTPYIRNGDQQSNSGKISIVNADSLRVDFLKDEGLETTAQLEQKIPLIHSESVESSTKSFKLLQLNPELKNCVTTILSVLYATFIVVIGSVMSMTESFLKANRPLSFELFYIFIYSASICFLIFVYVFLLRKRSGEIIRQAVRRLSFHDSQPMFRRVVTFSNVGHSGGFYLRLGAIGFGVGGMILDGLYIAEKFEDYGNPNSCYPGIAAATYIVKMVFAFSQLYFVFNNAEMRMLTHQSLAKFGLMHMTATNICEWYRTVVVETLETLTEEAEGQTKVTTNLTDHVHDLSNPVNSTDYKSCMPSKFVANIIKDTSPYLYPFKIEYNLICAGILYVMWRHLAYNSEVKRLPLSRSESNGDKRRRRLTVDCSSSSKGLFLGILLFVTVVISLKSFASLVKVNPNGMTVLFVSHCTEIGLYTMALISTVVAAFRMKDLKYDSKERAKLEENLIGISQLGLFMYGVFSMVAGSIEGNTARGAFTIVTSCLMMTQAALQTIFLFAAMRMSARKEQSTKPGREFVTFLLLCNFCMWVVNTFETIRPEHNSVQISIYGEDAWAIFVHISVPLAIFYRFHSTVCLSHIWKYAWKAKGEFR